MAARARAGRHDRRCRRAGPTIDAVRAILIYAFFASDGARAVLRRAGLSVGDDGLVYVGQTKNSFGARLSQHFKGSSNLGRSLGSVLKATPDDVSRFIRTHVRVAMLSLDDAVIGDVEARLIRTKSPPLNLAGVSNANSKRLEQLRRRLATTPITSTPILSTLAEALRWVPDSFSVVT